MPESALFLMQLSLPDGKASGSGLYGGGMGMLFVLLILLAGGLLAVWLLIKRQGPLRKGRFSKLDILETRPLGGRQFLLVGRYGKETFLLGVCPGRIDYLTRLENSPEESFNEVLSDIEDPNNASDLS